MTRSPIAAAAAATAVLALALLASPLTVIAALAAPFCVARCGRDLPDAERRVLLALLWLALAVRVALVAAQFLRGLPLLNDMSVGALSGDEAYYLSRALRVRDLMMGYAATNYDFFIVNDEYGQTSYLSVLTWLQIIFGPTPYSLKLVNGLLFVCACGVLFRVARSAFGPLPSFAALSMILFLPSLMFSSVSLLKESTYFFACALLIGCAWQWVGAASARNPARWAAAAAGMIVSLIVIDGLRRGGLVLMGGGLAVALAIWIVGQSRRWLAAAIVAGAIGAAAVVNVAPLNQRFVQTVAGVAKVHAGHVFTIGHVYKLLDDEFYVTPQAAPGWDLRLDTGQAVRFLARAGASFFVTPLPWQMRSAGELALLPEQILWYAAVLLLPFGIREGWRLNAPATALFVGIAVPTAIAVALTNGNVGTLFRLRGLVTPYLFWLSALGACAIGERIASSGRPLVLAEGRAL
jgi:hypothetical protein